MADPRQGRAGQSGYSPRLGRRDPRLRTNAAAAVTDQDLDNATIERDGQGRQRVKALDQLAPLPAKADLAAVIARLNLIVSKLKGL